MPDDGSGMSRWLEDNLGWDTNVESEHLHLLQAMWGNWIGAWMWLTGFLADAVRAWKDTR